MKGFGQAAAVDRSGASAVDEHLAAVLQRLLNGQKIAERVHIEMKDIKVLFAKESLDIPSVLKDRDVARRNLIEIAAGCFQFLVKARALSLAGHVNEAKMELGMINIVPYLSQIGFDPATISAQAELKDFYHSTVCLIDYWVFLVILIAKTTRRPRNEFAVI